MSSFPAGRVSRAKGVGRPSEAFYPSPFFDVAQQYMPRTVRETYPWVSFYQQTSPIVATVTSRLAAYPITDVFYEEQDGASAQYSNFFNEVQQLRTFLVEINLDRYTYGNGFASIAYPFEKKLTCKACKYIQTAAKSNYKWRNHQFHMQCPKCSHTGIATVTDQFIRSSERIRLIRWPPECIIPDHNSITGQTTYYYSIPQKLRSDITMGTRAIIEETPQVFIEAVRLGMAVKIENSKIFHMRRPSISRATSDACLGNPLIVPVLKDLFLVQILKKSQEAVALEHILPMRSVYPNITSDGNNVYANVNLQKWQQETEQQISRWRQDPNYISVGTVPMGYQLMGGQGRSYLLHQEIRMYTEMIVAGMGVPVAFVFGEAQFSGANVNMRAMENEFIGNRDDMLRLIRWMHKDIGSFMAWPAAVPKMKPFKMADDLQRLNFDMQLVTSRIKSKHSFMAAIDADYDKEMELIAEEDKAAQLQQRESTIAQAYLNGESMLIGADFQAMANAKMADAQAQQQAAMGPPPGEEQPQQGMPPPDPMAEEAPPQGYQGQADPTATAQALARQMQSMRTVDRYNRLQELKNTDAELATQVELRLNGGGVDMRPLPSKLPPRRGPGNAII